MDEKFKEKLLEAKAKPKKKNGKMLDKLHELDRKIEDFIEKLEDQINSIEDNPVYVRKCHKLIASMSKEYSEFIVALRAIVNALDRKSQIGPMFQRQESKIRDIMHGANDRMHSAMQSDDNEEEVEEE